MKIFLTGDNGYVGKVMAKMLYEQNYEVIGCDSEIFPQEFIKSKDNCVKHIKKDIRDITKDDLSEIMDIKIFIDMYSKAIDHIESDDMI